MFTSVSKGSTQPQQEKEDLLLTIKQRSDKESEALSEEEHMARGVKTESFKSDDSLDKSSKHGSPSHCYICVLPSIFESVQCPSCKCGTLPLKGQKESKMGLATLNLKCTGGKCSFSHPFYTSA